MKTQEKDPYSVPILSLGVESGSKVAQGFGSGSTYLPYHITIAMQGNILVVKSKSDLCHQAELKALQGVQRIKYLTQAGVEELFELDSLKGGVMSAEPSGSKPRLRSRSVVGSDGFGDGAMIEPLPDVTEAGSAAFKSFKQRFIFIYKFSGIGIICSNSEKKLFNTKIIGGQILYIAFSLKNL